MEPGGPMSWLYGTDGATVLRVASSGLLIYLVVVLTTRINGLRTFAKMSGYDFAATISVGSVIATVTLSVDVSVVEGLAAVAGIVGSQRIITELRARTKADRAIDNPPTLVLARGTVMEDLLIETGLNHEDLWATLRAAGLSAPAQATAVVFESGGVRTVLTGPVEQFDAEMFTSVKGCEHLFGGDGRVGSTPS